MLLWESTRRQGKVRVQTQRYVLQLAMVNHSEQCVFSSMMEIPIRGIWMLIVVLLH